MARIFQLNVSPGGVPTPAAIFARAIERQSRKVLAGYLLASADSWQMKIPGAREVTNEELEGMKLGELKTGDWGSHGRQKRERKLIEIVNDRDDKNFTIHLIHRLDKTIQKRQFACFASN